MKKIKSGIYGLNALLGGGINEKSTTCIIGSSGAGKTTAATQFLRRGLEIGQEGIYITLDEPPEQLVTEAVEMGWDDIYTYLEQELLVFIDASGREFSKFIRHELADFVADWEGANTRIAIDPLTPVLWSTKDKSEQRELISFFLRETKKIGTVLSTLEEHGTVGELVGDETIIPMYLSDSVIHLRYVMRENYVSRQLKIVKCRSSKHSKYTHPYQIMKGAGLVVLPSTYTGEDEALFSHLPEMMKRRLNKLPKDKVRHIPKPVRRRIFKMINFMKNQDFGNLQPEQFISYVLDEYDII